MSVSDCDQLATSISIFIMENKWEMYIDKLYKWPLSEPLKELKKLIQIPYSSVIDEWTNELSKGSYSATLKMREEFPKVHKNWAVKYNNSKIADWIVRSWGGIKSGVSLQFHKTLLIQHAQLKLAKNKFVFPFKRIASSSKYFAFLEPEKYAIYDARVIYSLNWIILQSSTGKNYFFPEPAGRNSVLGMINYDLFLYIKLLGIDKVQQILQADVDYRDKSITKAKSKLIENLKDELPCKGSHWIPEQDAFSEYCKLVREVGNKIFGVNDKLACVKTEMLLFAIADNLVALDVLKTMNVLSGSRGASPKISSSTTQ